jgi:hypothetical protein
MARELMSPLPAFTLEALVTSRQWTAEQRSTRKKPNPAKTGARAATAETNTTKTAK